MDKNKSAPVAFVQKIKDRMQSQNLGIRDLARKLKVSHPTITEIVTYGNKPSFDTCLALAAWLGQNPVSVLREAGLLPPDISDDATFDDWKELLASLDPRDEAFLRETARHMIQTRGKDLPQS